MFPRVPMLDGFRLVVPPAGLQATLLATHLEAVVLLCDFSQVSVTVVLAGKYPAVAFNLGGSAAAWAT